jgi:hypothetical protein
MGGVLAFFSLWSYPEGTAQRICAWGVFVVGLGSIIGGIALFWLSRRSPYLVLRADHKGLQLVERFRPRMGHTYLQLPWACINEFEFCGTDVGYGLRIMTSLPEMEVRAIRAKQNQEYKESPNVLMFPIPLIQLPARETDIVELLQGIKRGATNGHV